MENTQVTEKLNVKGAQRVQQDAKEATKKALDGVRDNLVGKGFKKEDVVPFIRQGAREAAEEHK